MWSFYIVLLAMFRSTLADCDPEARTGRRCPVSVHCQRTCANPNPFNCSFTDPPKRNIDGCQCKSGYILSKSKGKCIKIEECPKGCNNDPHAVAKECPVPCPATCEMPEPMLTCRRQCDPIGCECEPGYLLSHGKCILPDNCKGGNPCGENAFFTSSKFSCPTDYCPVDDNRAILICEFFGPNYPGCVCKLNHKRKSHEDNRCIISSDCPPVDCTRQNEEWSSCPSDCLAETCDDVDRQVPVCNTLVLNCQPKCICRKDTYRNESDICISSDDCRNINKSKPVCGYNEEYVNCKTVCPPQSCDISYTEYRCEETACEPGCDCIKDHLRNSSGICILNDECPSPSPQPVCGYNEEYVNCKTVCPPQSCENSYTEYRCEETVCEPGCDCIKDHLRNSSGICILNEECPSPSSLPTCGYNEKPSACKTVCPPQRCGVDPAVIRCAKPDCEPGCDCIDGHLRNDSGICIPSNKCLPKCGLHEIAVPCKRICPPQSCLSLISLFSCPENITCEPGCDCEKNYLRNNAEECIPSDQCFQSDCSIPAECRPTCAVPNPKDCSYTEPPNSNIDGCQCQKGYVLSEPEGKCIKVDECPQDIGCNGDSHAVIRECPWPCPSTCDAPNTIQCRKACEAIGCQCQPGYLLSSINGKCILPDQCEYGNPCGINGTYSDCGFRCPNQYCPQDDDRTVIACKPGRPCPPGCTCKGDYRRKNYEEPNICVHASDCAPVKCTRPNEVWNSCPSCRAERCEDLNNPTICDDPPGTNCQPKCVCADGYCRDQSDTCVYEDGCN